jgi:hypothetical protein
MYASRRLGYVAEGLDTLHKAAWSIKHVRPDNHSFSYILRFLIRGLNYLETSKNAWRWRTKRNLKSFERKLSTLDILL